MCNSSTLAIGERVPSDKRIVAYLEDEDWELWKKALQEYGMKESPLLKEIIHSWLFQNRLNLMKKKK